MELANTLAYYDTATKMAVERNSRKFSFKKRGLLVFVKFSFNMGLTCI
jgi:hypothetical protein